MTALQEQAAKTPPPGLPGRSAGWSPHGRRGAPRWMSNTAPPGQAGRGRKRLSAFLAQRLRGPDGFLQADQPVAVRVDLAELFVGAQELPARHVAVAVAVHLVEPRRPP